MEERKLSGGCEENRFDLVMEKVGYRGKFQRRYNIIFNFLLVIAASMPYLNIILALSVPEHWCHVPGRNVTNFTLDEWKNLTLPREVNAKGKENFSKCKMYNISVINQNEQESVPGNHEIIDCQLGWDFDRTWYTETAPSEGKWVCEKELFVTNAFAFGRIGDVIGTFTFGQLGDTIGRRPVFYITLITLITGRILSAFSVHNYSLFLFATLLGSLASTAVFQAPVIVAMEISEESQRAHIAMLRFLGWTLAICIIPFILWAWGHWYYFMLTTTLPCIVFLFSHKMMIESPRWLVGQGKTAKAIRQLEIIAKVNGTTVPSDAMIILRQKSGNSEKSFGMMSLFSNWRLAKNTTLLLFSWVSNAIIYYVIILNVSSLGGNPFMNFFWQSFAEFPAVILGKVLSDRIGRRWTQSVSFLTAAFGCILLIFFISDPNFESVSSGLAAFVKFAISVAFYACELQTLEIYPTCVRQSGISLGAISSSAFGILGPYIVYLGTAFDARYPPLILTTLSLTAAVSSTFLPETLNHKLPETLKDAQNFGADQIFWSFPKSEKK